MADGLARTIVIGTRGSALAMWQANYVMGLLQARHPDRRFVLQRIVTRGDGDTHSPLAGIGTQGVFVKEIEAALLAGEIDLGVHSLKDLPSEQDPGLKLAGVCPREDPRDVLVSKSGATLEQLPAGARVGTGSPRRAAQIKANRPDLAILGIRGNVDTRVRKALSDEFEAVVLAAAGLRRLGLEQNITEYLESSTMLSAPCQGIVGIESRAEDEDVIALVQAVSDPMAELAARAERAFVRELGGGCTTPLAARAVIDGRSLSIDGLLASPDGVRLIRDHVAGYAEDPERAGAELARRILAAGGAKILAEIETYGVEQR